MKPQIVFSTVVVLAAAAPMLGGNAGVAHAQRKHDTCDYCHDLHGAGSAQLMNYDRAEDLCMSCHADGAPATYNGEAVPKGVTIHAGSKHAADDTTSCRDCHDHEGETGTNLALIPTTMDNRYTGGPQAVVFTSRGTDAAQDSTDSFADGDGTGVCEVCHTTATVHNYGRTCPDCHGHDGGFAGGGGACTDCHNGVQGSRRAVVGEFGRASHHAATPADTLDCVVCHDQSQHQQGNVRLSNVDYPAVPDSSVVLTGDPNSSDSEAALLVKFCLACHDADGANGDATPFSDNVSVPAVDAAAWSAASHNSSSPQVSCYGDGSFGCHASGHGSEKQNLLAPGGVAPSAPANSEEEEGFCFNCHDSDGPATADVQTQFNSVIQWVTDIVGDYNNTNLNDRHDVQYAAQDTSGAKIECTDCHNPHTATASQPFMTDPDPSDGRTPGTGQVMSGASLMTEFCLDCHDGGYPSAITPPTTLLDTIRDTWLTDAMGAGGGNATLISGIGWADNDTMPCLACHNPHVTGNFFHAADTVYSKDGSTALWYYVKNKQGAVIDSLIPTITDNSVNQTDINGYAWCNTCHDNSMGDKKTNCFECHYHGTRW